MWRVRRYFVQQIDRVFDIRECDAEVAHVTTETYWEAWNVKKGDKKEAHASQFTFTDSSTQPSRNGKQGKTVSAGVIKFFCSTTTGDLGDMNVAPASSASAWGPARSPGTGSQPSTGEKPAWWDTVPDGKAATRSATSTWVCCPDRPRKNELACDPKVEASQNGGARCKEMADDLEPDHRGHGVLTLVHPDAHRCRDCNQADVQSLVDKIKSLEPWRQSSDYSKKNWEAALKTASIVQETSSALVEKALDAFMAKAMTGTVKGDYEGVEAVHAGCASYSNSPRTQIRRTRSRSRAGTTRASGSRVVSSISPGR